MAHQDVYLNFIQGQWNQGSSGQWDANRNPAKPSEVLGKSTRSTQVDVGRAIDAASKAQAEWAQKPRPARGAIIHSVAQIIKRQAETFATTLTREEGKNIAEARGEIAKTINVLEFM